MHAKSHPSDRVQAKHRRPREEERGIVADDSEAFYQDSKRALTASVSQMIQESPGNFFYAGLPEITEEDGTVTVDPNYAFGAPGKHQWSIPIRILFIWAIFKDNKYWFRQPLCRQYVHNPIDKLVCDSNTAFHPNVAGAKAYAQSIETAIPQSILLDLKSEIRP